MRGGNGRAESSDPASDTRAGQPSSSEDGTLLVDIETRQVTGFLPDIAQSPGAAGYDEGWNGGVVGNIDRRQVSLGQAWVQIEALALANRRKNEFLAMLSHELRSPLASMRYAMRVLGSENTEVATRQRMHALVERQLLGMTRLVEELVDVSRITSGRAQLLRERIDLRVIVSHAIETLEPDLQARNHQVAIALPDTPIWLQVDAGRLEQVFVNLVPNAARYTDAGGQLAVSVHTNGDKAVVRVRDSGIGIAPEALPHIFDLFRQANAADPRSRPGLGVGLAVVRNLVELHGGNVTAASAGVGQGSEFTVRFNLSE